MSDRFLIVVGYALIFVGVTVLLLAPLVEWI